MSSDHKHASNKPRDTSITRAGQQSVVSNYELNCKTKGLASYSSSLHWRRDETAGDEQGSVTSIFLLPHLNRFSRCLPDIPWSSFVLPLVQKMLQASFFRAESWRSYSMDRRDTQIPFLPYAVALCCGSAAFHQ